MNLEPFLINNKDIRSKIATDLSDEDLFNLGHVSRGFYTVLHGDRRYKNEKLKRVLPYYHYSTVSADMMKKPVCGVSLHEPVKACIRAINQEVEEIVRSNVAARDRIQALQRFMSLLVTVLPHHQPTHDSIIALQAKLAVQDSSSITPVWQALKDFLVAYAASTPDEQATFLRYCQTTGHSFFMDLYTLSKISVQNIEYVTHDDHKSHPSGFFSEPYFQHHRQLSKTREQTEKLDLFKTITMFGLIAPVFMTILGGACLGMGFGWEAAGCIIAGFVLMAVATLLVTLVITAFTLHKNRKKQQTTLENKFSELLEDPEQVEQVERDDAIVFAQ